MGFKQHRQEKLIYFYPDVKKCFAGRIKNEIRKATVEPIFQIVNYKNQEKANDNSIDLDLLSETIVFHAV